MAHQRMITVFSKRIESADYADQKTRASKQQSEPRVPRVLTVCHSVLCDLRNLWIPDVAGLFRAYFFSNLFLSRKASTAALNSFGFSIMMKWPTPSHIWNSRLEAMPR